MNIANSPPRLRELTEASIFDKGKLSSHEHECHEAHESPVLPVRRTSELVMGYRKKYRYNGNKISKYRITNIDSFDFFKLFKIFIRRYLSLNRLSTLNQYMNNKISYLKFLKSAR